MRDRCWDRAGETTRVRFGICAPKIHIAPVRRSGHQQKKIPNLHPECLCLGFHVFWLWLVYVSSTLEIGAGRETRFFLGFLGLGCGLQVFMRKEKGSAPMIRGKLGVDLSDKWVKVFTGPRFSPGILPDSPETVVVRVGMSSHGL